MLEELYKEGKKELSTAELCREIGLRCCNEDSILYWAAKNNIPVFVPGITDGSVGYQLWFFSQDHKDFQNQPAKRRRRPKQHRFRRQKKRRPHRRRRHQQAPHDLVEPIQRRLRLRRLHHHCRRVGRQPQRRTTHEKQFHGEKSAKKPNAS